MTSLIDTPERALEVLAGTGFERWSITRPGAIGILLACLDVHLRDPVERFSFSVTGWTHEELHFRIDGIRRSAATLLERRRSGEPEE